MTIEGRIFWPHGRREERFEFKPKSPDVPIVIKDNTREGTEIDPDTARMRVVTRHKIRLMYKTTEGNDRKEDLIGEEINDAELMFRPETEDPTQLGTIRHVENR